MGCGEGCILKCCSLLYHVEIIGTWDPCPMTSCSGAKLCAGIVQYHPVYIPYVVCCTSPIITLFCWCLVFGVWCLWSGVCVSHFLSFRCTCLYPSYLTCRPLLPHHFRLYKVEPNPVSCPTIPFTQIPHSL